MRLDELRHIDVLVAETMGLDVVWLEDGQSAPSPLGTATGPGGFIRWADYAGLAVYPAPDHTTNIADAWQVVEWMLGHGYCLKLHVGVTNRAMASFHRPMEHRQFESAHTVSLAICLAFLKAMGVDWKAQRE